MVRWSARCVITRYSKASATIAQKMPLLPEDTTETVALLVKTKESLSKILLLLEVTIETAIEEIGVVLETAMQVKTAIGVVLEIEMQDKTVIEVDLETEMQQGVMTEEVAVALKIETEALAEMTDLEMTGQEVMIGQTDHKGSINHTTARM